MKLLSSICFLYFYCSAVTAIDDVLLDRLQHIKPQVSDDYQSHAVMLLIQRLIPEHSSSFIVTVNSKEKFNVGNGMDAFELITLPDKRLHISATTGVAAASGFYYYLKYYCGCSVSWSGDQLNLPTILPVVKESVQKQFHERFRYYQNVCTVSYSMAFWDWSRWEREIDWMALNGINLPLAFTGQESVWKIVYEKLGLTEQELDTHFSGPAFFAWQRMGNLDSWGGPLPSSWYDRQLNLQQQILKRMRSLGMIPVLPGFAGHIPKPLITRLYPDAKHYKLEGWNGFQSQYGTYLLDVQEPLFQKIGSMFIKAQQQLYNGTDHVYNADVYNEMRPPTLTTTFMATTSKSIFQAMTNADSKAVWLMQAWQFLATYWTKDLMTAWFSAVPYGRLILEAVGSELKELYIQKDGYYGYPFIWTMINNFGGSTRLYGQLGLVSNDIVNARKSYANNLIGIGSTPEGIEQNDVNFELLYEMGWRNEAINVTEWGILYSQRRYDSQNIWFQDAWTFLSSSLYDLRERTSNGGGAFGRVVVMMPYIDANFTSNLWYDPRKMRQAWYNLFRASHTFRMNYTEAFRYDLVHLGAQCLEDISIITYQQMMKAYTENSIDDFLTHAQYLTDLIEDMDSLLSTEPHSLLGYWIESARKWGDTDTEKALLEFNARNQVTMWGPNENVLDYANKQWAGLLSGYYRPRWVTFTKFVVNCMQKKIPFDRSTFNTMVWNASYIWNESLNPYPSKPVGDWFMESERLIKKYMNIDDVVGIDGLEFWKSFRGRRKDVPTSLKNKIDPYDLL